jgi:hypothetical protein
MSDTNPFLYSEKLTAKQFGIPRAELRLARQLHLEPEIDWKKNEAGAVLLSDSGLKRLLGLTGNVTGEDLSSIDVASLLAEKNGAHEPPQFTVVAVCANPRMVLANDSGDPDEERELVDVGRNKNFAVGDVISVARHETQQGVWQLLDKLPRTDRRPGVEGSLRDPSADWGRKGEDVLRKAKQGKKLTANERETLRSEGVTLRKARR